MNLYDWHWDGQRYWWQGVGKWRYTYTPSTRKLRREKGDEWQECPVRALPRCSPGRTLGDCLASRFTTARRTSRVMTGSYEQEAQSNAA